MEEKYRIIELNHSENRFKKPGYIPNGNKNFDDWYTNNEIKFFFKRRHPPPAPHEFNPPSDWVEKVVCELGKLLGLPVAQYEFANIYYPKTDRTVEGTISVNCISQDNEEIKGAEFLITASKFSGNNLTEHTIQNILEALDLADVLPPFNWEQAVEGINTGAELFVGYTLLDALTNNTDRNSNNWSVTFATQSGEQRLELIPSFDHANSLGSETNNPLDYSPSNYTNQYKSIFTEGNRRLSTLEVFDRAAQLYPAAAQIWQKKLAAITPEQIDEIFARIPDDRITQNADRFARQLLEYNRGKILEITPSQQLQQNYILQVKDEISEIETNLDNSPNLDNPEPPASPPSPRPKPKPPTPPNSPDDAANSPDTTNSTDSPPISTNTNRQPGTTTGLANLSKLAEEYNREAVAMREEVNQKIRALVRVPSREPLLDTPLTKMPPVATSFAEIEPPPVPSMMKVTFSDINNYQDYLQSKEYKQQLPQAEREDLGRKAGEIINPIMNQFRSIARAEAGEFLPAPHPYFRTFETELDLSEQDRQGIKVARDWAGRQTKTPVKDTEPPRDPER